MVTMVMRKSLKWYFGYFSLNYTSPLSPFLLARHVQLLDFSLYWPGNVGYMLLVYIYVYICIYVYEHIYIYIFITLCRILLPLCMAIFLTIFGEICMVLCNNTRECGTLEHAMKQTLESI